MVHDGARPLVTGEVVSRVVSEAQREGGAIAGIPVSDTVKRTEDHTILETVDREDLILAQTPQVFDEDRFREALEQIDEEKISGITDDAMVMKEAGYEVRTARGDRWNIKVTYPSDLRVATHFM